nr:phosphotransferase family protein [Brevibacterium daeguense]
MAPAGIDPQKVGRWIENRFGVSEVTYSVLSIGRSNLTFTVEVDGQKRWVLRRPPLGHKGGSAHNVAREGRIMAALGPTDVPVTNVLEIVDDPEVMEVPFVFMEHCPGFPINTPEDWARIPEDRRRGTAFGMVDTLAAIHRVDVEAVGLGDLRRPGGLIERQLRRWLGQFEDITQRDIPEIREVHDVLKREMPEFSDSAIGIAHGDYKPNNMIFAPDGTINAVVDWELTAIGEVLTDLGYFIAMLTTPDELTSIWVPRPADGFPTTEELIARYEDRSGIRAENVDYYAAFAMWKLACIREGVYTRLITGQMGDLDFDPETAGAGVESLARQALAILKEEN